MSEFIIGCDLSRACLDLHTLPDGLASRIDNSPEAIDEWVTSRPPGCWLVFEATSGCAAQLIAGLCARGVSYSRVNPRQAREFARVLGVLAKTDQVDARILAVMGLRIDLAVTVTPDPARMRLADYMRRRRQQVDMRKAEKFRRHSAGQRDILKDIDSLIRILDRRIEVMDDMIRGWGSGRRRSASYRCSRRRTNRASHPAWRTARAWQARPTKDRLPCRTCAACPRKRNIARDTQDMGRRAKGPPGPLHRGTLDIAANPGSDRDVTTHE